MTASIESTVDSNELAELVLSWSRGFRTNILTAEDIHDRFAALDVSTMEAAEPVRQRVIQAQRELDAVRWGMCAAGQQAEIGRILGELERVLANHKTV